MTSTTMLKLGQIAGAVFMIAGVAACQMGKIQSTPFLMLAGGVIYGGCCMTQWMLNK